MGQFTYRCALLHKGDAIIKGALIFNRDSHAITWYGVQSSIPLRNFSEDGDFAQLVNTSGLDSNYLLTTEYESIEQFVAAFNRGKAKGIHEDLRGGLLAIEDKEHEYDLETENILYFNIHEDYEGSFSFLGKSPSNAFISPNYSCSRVYLGKGRYHTHNYRELNGVVGKPPKYRIGVELEVCSKTASDSCIVDSYPSNWFYKESDSSLDGYGTEIITVPLLPSDAKSMEFWEPLTLDLNKHAWSWKKSCCGLHVHIGREILGTEPEEISESLGKLLYFYHHIITDGGKAQEMNEKIYGRAHTYHESQGKTEVGNAVKILGSGVLKQKGICEKVKDCMISTNGRGRYFDINIQPSATIEFRKGKGSISAKRITAVIAWSEAMVLYCRKTAWEKMSYQGFIDYVMASKGTPKSLNEYIASEE